MTEHRVRRDHAARQDQVFQHVQRHLMFVGVRRNLPLMEHAFRLRIDHRQEVHGSLEPMPCAAERLAVQRRRQKFGRR